MLANYQNINFFYQVKSRNFKISKIGNFVLSVKLSKSDFYSMYFKYIM